MVFFYVVMVFFMLLWFFLCCYGFFLSYFILGKNYKKDTYILNGPDPGADAGFFRCTALFKCERSEQLVRGANDLYRWGSGGRCKPPSGGVRGRSPLRNFLGFLNATLA